MSVLIDLKEIQVEAKNTRLEERVLTVQRHFINSLPSHITHINTYWKALRYTAWDSQTATDLQIIAHRLSGSGGTFGFPDITRTAALLDASLKEVSKHIINDSIKNEIIVSPEYLLMIERQINELLCVLKSTLANSPANNEEFPILTSYVKSNKQPLIVVIDDDNILLERISIFLEDAGYRVECFSSPANAISLLQEEQPALILLDLMFPRQRFPAFEVIADLRGETGQRTPVAVISGYADFRSRLKATRAGADAYLAKPIDDRELLATVAKLAQQSNHEGWRCLVIDDDEILVTQLVQWLCESGMVAEGVSSPSESWLKIKDFNPDILVLDINMPECNGIEFASILRQDSQTSQLPVIFLTSDNSEHTRRDAMASGADDYLLKPINKDILINAINARAKLGKRIQSQLSLVTKHALKKGEGLSKHFFFNEFERVIDEADEKSTIHEALVLIGMACASDFINNYGALGVAALHEQLIKRVSPLNIPIWTMLGESTIGILLPRDTPAAHQVYLTDLLARLSKTSFFINGTEVDSRMSAASLHLRHGQTAATTILLQAEQMLSVAIQKGPNTIINGFIGVPEAVEATHHLPVERLRIVYQPIVTIAEDGDPVSMILARLTDKAGNLLPAGKFLSSLEKRGWLAELDAWVFRQAHSLLTTKIAENEAQSLIIHASERSLNNAVYIETVLSILAEHPMRNKKQRIIIAISEESSITYRGMVVKLNDALRHAGGGLMITNYGSSTHSMSVLNQLQPIFVRLDESLTRRLEHENYDPLDRRLIETTQEQNTIIVASGIESAKSVSGLWAKGIRWFQGYFIQEPSSVLTSL